MHEQHSPACSDSTAKIADALAKAQSEFPEIRKDRTATITSARTGKSHSYRYADLTAVLNAVRPVLNKHGIAICDSASLHLDAPQQSADGGMQPRRGQVAVRCRLLHVSGEWLSATLAMPTDSTPQSIGSAITYARRYALCALVGVLAEDDDDAAQAASATVAAPPAPAPRPPVPEPAAPAQPATLTVHQRYLVAVARIRQRLGPEAGAAKIAEITQRHAVEGKVPAEKQTAYVADLEGAAA